LEEFYEEESGRLDNLKEARKREELIGENNSATQMPGKENKAETKEVISWTDSLNHWRN
jgi:hypothetical protein